VDVHVKIRIPAVTRPFNGLALVIVHIFVLCAWATLWRIQCHPAYTTALPLLTNLKSDSVTTTARYGEGTVRDPGEVVTRINLADCGLARVR
jgi:hypothetical protein